MIRVITHTQTYERWGHLSLIRLKITLEKAIEDIRKTIDIQNGESPLVARK